MRAQLLLFLTMFALGSVALEAAPRLISGQRQKLDRIGPLRVSHPPPGRVVGTTPQGNRLILPDPSQMADMAYLAEKYFGNQNGDGGTGDVVDGSLVVLQTNYNDLDFGNVALMIWTEDTFNPPECSAGVVPFDPDNPEVCGVAILINGDTVAHRMPIPEAEVPAANFLFITQLTPGTYEFGVESVNDGTSATDEIEIVDTQPFANPQNLHCEAASTPDMDGRCNTLVSWTNSGVPRRPDDYCVTITPEGGERTVIGCTGVGDIIGAFIGPQPPGSHQIELIAFLTFENPDTGIISDYRGDPFVEATCNISCQPGECPPVAGLLVCQTNYNGDAGGPGVFLDWFNATDDVGDPLPYEDIGISVDGESAGTVAGDTARVGLTFGAGTEIPAEGTTLTFGVQPNCGDPAGQAVSNERSLTLLAESPHANPIVADSITCVYDEAEGGSTTVTWQNADPSALIDIYVETADEPGTLFYAGTLLGSAEAVQIGGTLESDNVWLQFFATPDEEPNTCYGSPLISACDTGPVGNVALRGVCNGTDSSVQISSAIFSLNFQFGGGPPPPCRAACDANADGDVNVADPVYTLNFLFAGGPHPPTWPDKDTPTCELFPEEDCAEPNTIADCVAP